KKRWPRPRRPGSRWGGHEGHWASPSWTGKRRRSRPCWHCGSPRPPSPKSQAWTARHSTILYIHADLCRSDTARAVDRASVVFCSVTAGTPFLFKDHPFPDHSLKEPSFTQWSFRERSAREYLAGEYSGKEYSEDERLIRNHKTSE